jgi:5-methylcytosine-specific restriction enzyme B
MTELEQSVRKALILRKVLEILDEAGGAPVPKHQVMAELPNRIELTSYELEKSGKRQRERWRPFPGWGSIELDAAGWLTKSSQGWAITPAGQKALVEYDENELLHNAGAAWRAANKQKKLMKAFSAPGYQLVDHVLAVLEEGEWATYTAVGELTGVSPQNVGKYINTVPSEGGHRVLLVEGRCGSDFQWADPRPESQREVLETEGVAFDVSGVADPESHVGVEELRERVEEVVGPLAKRRAWFVRGSSVNGRDLIPVWLERGSVSLAASKLRPVEPPLSREDLKPVVDEDYGHMSYAAKAEKLDEFYLFLSKMQPRDLVATTSQGRLYIGEIAGPATYVPSPDGRSNLRRDVHWLEPKEGVDYAQLPGEISARLQSQRDAADMTLQLEALQALVAPDSSPASESPQPRQRVSLPDATEELAASLHVTRGWLQECIDLLRDRPQLIFYGPPGTGKTYIAQELARHVAGDNYKLVQFHPAYSYEDFFEGYRPARDGGSVGFKLTAGPLRRIVDQAEENSGSAYVLIIDEINRGNLAKIFGELYFLLEYRNKSIDLLYSSGDEGDHKEFALPENVFIIGTMNTADRSIALVDAAMRRRFAFLPLHPAEPPTSGILRSWLAAEKLPSLTADLLDELNERIPDDDFKIGPSYFMREAVHQPGGLERAWRTAIMPLLEEFHYGESVDVEKHYGLGQVRAAVQRRAQVVSDPGGGDPLEPTEEPLSEGSVDEAPGAH